MELFTAWAILIASQWPGAWAPEEVPQAATTAVTEVVVGRDYQLARLGGYTCLAVENLKAAPYCKERLTSIDLVEKLQNSLTEVLETTDQLMP